jgi:hypothetical protein
MFRILAAALLILVSAQVEAAESSRKRLPGFNGILFGTPFETARQKLGPDAKADKDPADPKVNILLGQADIYGQAFTVNYTFGKKDRLSTVFAVAKMPPGDYTVCKSYWTKSLSGLKNEYGVPDSAKNQIDATIQFADVSFAFGDGATIDASLMGCLLMITYTAADGAR